MPVYDIPTIHFSAPKQAILLLDCIWVSLRVLFVPFTSELVEHFLAP
jgi:hypothetical protein